MSDKNGKPERHRRSRKRLSITRFAWGMVAVGALLGLAAVVTGSDSAFLWIDVGICLSTGIVLFLVGLIGCRSRPGREAPAAQLGRTAFVLAAVIAILAPAAKGVVELVELGPIVRPERECNVRPAEPPPDAPPS